jgi:hypothetical protein
MTIESTHVNLTFTCRHCDNDTDVRVRVDFISDGEYKDAVPEYLTGIFCKHCRRPMDGRILEDRARKCVLGLK